jgi:protein gp37
MATNIEWTKGNKTAAGDLMPGRTWNPTVGCTEKSRGCQNCYAARMAWRIAHMNNKASKDYEGTVKKLPNGKVVWTGKVNLLPVRLLEPVMNRKPTTYFVDSMSDLFHESIPFEFIDQVMAIMALCPQHIFQVLTKRLDRLLKYMQKEQDFDYIGDNAEVIVSENPHLFHIIERLTSEAKKTIGPVTITNELLPHLKEAGWGWWHQKDENGLKDGGLIYEGDWPAKNIWLGGSIENQKAANDRFQPLYDLHRMRWMTWVSNEPCVGPIDWNEPYYGFLDWMVTGGESGAAASPMHPDWVRATRDFCEKNNIPWFFKQWGEYTGQIDMEGSGDTEPTLWLCKDGRKGITEQFAIKDLGNWCGVYKVGKHNAGRLLDGTLHDQMPVLKTTEDHETYKK